MTTKYDYKCNKCGYDYTEQRRDDELNPFFVNCVSCFEGINEEVSKTFIEPDFQPEVIIEESVL